MSQQIERELSFDDNLLLIELCGEFDKNLAQIENRLGLRIDRRGNVLNLVGPSESCDTASRILNQLFSRLQDGKPVDASAIDAVIRMGETYEDEDQIEMFQQDSIEIRTRKKTVEPRTPTQKSYVKQLLENELVFGLGPAGTGKTYLAVAVGVAHFLEGRVDRIVLSRPAVEAGERLGFLPGDMKDKVDPYMQPLYDALHDFLPGKQLYKLIEEKKIEIAPLAFMRGRTLANAYIVLDEAQNATKMQMKMFLTRMGEGAIMAITGDVSQIDLPKNTPSGLIEAERILKGVDGIGFSYFSANDVVRHPLVAKIIHAYEKSETSRSRENRGTEK